MRFVSVTESAGFTSKVSSGAAPDLAAFLGPGACFLDYDADGKPDLFLPDNGPQGGMALYHNLGNGKFEDVTKKAGLDPSIHAIGCTAGDYDNDGATDLAVSLNGRVLLLHNEKNGTFKDVTDSAGIKSDGLNLGLTFIDYDHDGDLDLYVTRFINVAAPVAGRAIALPFDQLFPGNVMWRNNGNGSFTSVTDSVGLSGDAPSMGAVGTDYNNDRAIDLVVTGWQSGPTVFENPREGKFSLQRLWNRSVSAGTAGVAILDFDHDGWTDLAFTELAAPGISLWRNNHKKAFEPVELPKTNWTRAWGVTAFDYDNDGWIDLAAVGETADGKGEVRLFRNLGPDGFKDVTADVGLDKIQLKDPRAIVTADYDADGATDLLITQNHGPAVLLRNDGGNKNNWLRVSFKGLADNKSAIGTKVEISAGANRQKFEIARIVRLSRTKLSRLRRRARSRQRSRCGAHAVAVRSHSGRNSDCRNERSRFRGIGPARQFLSHAFCVERKPLRTGRRHARRGRGRPLDRPRPARYSAAHGIHQSAAQVDSRARWQTQFPLHGADGRSGLSRSGEVDGG